MYAVSPEVEGAWRALLAHVAQEAGAKFEYFSYPAPQPLEPLWRREDLGLVFMCGYPIASQLATVRRLPRQSRGHPGRGGGHSIAPI